MEDKIKGVLLGQAAGDALGAGYETGKRPEEGKADMIGGGFGFEPGEYTDDTEQAVCVALAKSDPYRVAENLIGWFKGMPKDVGGTTARLLGTASHYPPGQMPEIAARFAERDAGYAKPPGWDPGMANGSLMRTGPVCLPFLGKRDAIAGMARTISNLTHHDPWAGDACVLWSLAIEDAITHEDFDLRVILEGLEYVPVDRRDFWRDAISDAFDSRVEAPRRNGSAVGAFKAALKAVAYSKTLEDGLQRAVAIGGDTDTVAAIAGALLGAIHGASAVPDDWRRMVHGWSPKGRIWARDLDDIALRAAGIGHPGEWEGPRA